MRHIPRRTVLALAGALAIGGPGRAAEPRRLLRVLQRDAAERVIGTVELDAAFRLDVVTAEPDRAEWLRNLVRRINEKQVLFIDAAPAPGQPRFTQASRSVGRGDPEFLEALKDELRRYYDIELQ